MKNLNRKYEMRVNQINENVFRLMLVYTGRVDRVVYETISSTIPSTLDLISRYRQTES
jgi:hypothetical protein